MADYTVDIDLAAHKLGNKWVGIVAVGPVLVNGSQPTGSLAKVRMDFVRRGTRYSLSSDPAESPDAPITITDAATWTVVVPEVQDFLPSAGAWKWDMEFYETGDTRPMTFYQGVLNVYPRITTDG